ncbi:ester cyclase [Agriterribacter sp.]|uniref:ester cyclase n=1 Tax=Agriterribacter sp. TaxID=2821509 RepID=UPI002C249EF4|nr:ester cyclase [Agriterribacter sp.]HRP57461.1 ester cyclase [Agriterribacter sp.]
MKPLLLTGVLLTFFTGCGENNSTSHPATDRNATASVRTEESKEERNKQTALLCIKSWGTGNMNEIVKHLAINTVDYGDGSTPPARGIDTVKSFMNLWRFSVEEYKSANELAVSDSDYVFIYADWSGRFKSDFMGMKTAGKSFRFKDVDIFRFDDEGKITEHRAVLFSTMLRDLATRQE